MFRTQSRSGQAMSLRSQWHAIDSRALRYRPQQKICTATVTSSAFTSIYIGFAALTAVRPATVTSADRIAMSSTVQRL